ncbi:MAG: hypothetical protein U1C48_05090 [Methylotenera sp.]|nr:hypothetical protein [Methylotenera sp.]
MTIYQVLDEQNYIVNEYKLRDVALRCLKDMAAWFPDHSYHITELAIEVTTDEQPE